MYKQAPKTPAMKALIGNQGNLNPELKAAIEAASPSKQTKRRVRTGTPDRPSSKRRVPPAPKVPVGPKAEKPKTKKEVFMGKATKTRKMMKEKAPMPGKRVELPSKPIPSVAKQTAKSKDKFDGYKSIGESDTEKGAHLIRSRSVKSNTAATDHKISKTAEGKYKVYKSKSPAKQTKAEPSITGKKTVPNAPKVPVGPKAEKPKTKKEVAREKAYKKLSK